MVHKLCLKDVRANCLCATFLSISSKRCVRVRQLRARKNVTQRCVNKYGVRYAKLKKK